MELMERRCSVYILLDNSLIYLKIVFDNLPNISTSNRITGVLHSSFQHILNQLYINAYLE